MKLKIEYNYLMGEPYPYRAVARIGKDEISTINKFSFEAAKDELIEKLKDEIKKCPTIIPEPEEVEV